MSDDRPTGKFGPNPDEGPIDGEMIVRAARELRVQGEQLAQQKREHDAQYHYQRTERYYVLLEQRAQEPPLWTASLIEGTTRDGLEVRAHARTREVALQRMHWQYALALARRFNWPWHECRKRARETEFLDAGG